ncbi:MAG TPA: tetratricopeptide repeat protein [Candidatus Binatia bacterium]|nr:tetratricopeptide repeat protein [Candidatus Binatia bacterium]
MNSTIALILLALVVLTGCARALGRAETSLYAGRYDEAAARFQEVLAAQPDNADALVGLGIAKYRLGTLDEAERAFAEAGRRAPERPVPQLYLGLIALLRGQDAAGGESLRRYAAAGAPRVALDIERALRALGSGPATEEMRRYVASSIEDQAAWAGELLATQQALAGSDQRRITEDRTLLLLPHACRCR